jgi:hypothetical protein
MKIAGGDLDDTEIIIGFQDQNVVVLQGVDDPSGQVYIGFDENYVPSLVWRRRGFWRTTRRFFIGCFHTLKSVLLNTLAISAGVAVKAIKWL